VAADGKWNITVNSPMGAQKSTFDLKAEGNVLSGAGIDPQGSTPIANGKVDGDSVSWDFSVKVPMPMTLSFAGKIEGNKISGNVKAGAFGSFAFSGERV
jgi:hypothetical protein